MQLEAPPLPRGMTSKEVAEILRVDAGAVRRWIKEGSLKALNVNRKGMRPRYIVLPNQLEAFTGKITAIAVDAPEPPRRRKSLNITDYYPD